MVEAILDQENFTLEELLDEEEIIQECKALNSRLINFLRDRAQVEQLLRYIVEEPPEDAESNRAFKFPFISCEIFTCEIDVILKTLVEEEELMHLLFSFLEPNRPHSTLRAGYFSKVVVCLMIRKTLPLMNYVKAHQNVVQQLVDLIGITSIMEVLVRLVGADDHVYPNFIDVIQWLVESNLLEMIVDKLCPSSPPEVHANAAETLCTITQNASSALAIKLSSPSFVARILDHALEDSQSKSSLICSLSVCISLLDSKRSASLSPLFYSFRSQHMYEAPVPVNPETIGAMLQKLGELLMLLHVSSDEKVLPTTYGELRPPLGKHRLKIVEFIAVLLKAGNELAEVELVNSGIIRRVIDLFFEYPFNNSLHHHVESIILSCLESKTDAVVDYLLQECDIVGKVLGADKNPVLYSDGDQPTVAASGTRTPRAGNIGHITRFANKLVNLAYNQSRIQAFLQKDSEWNDWQAAVLQERNVVENVHRWDCGRPCALHDRMRDSDDDLHNRDYDVAALADNLSQAFKYKIYGNEDNEEDHGGLDRDDEDVYFDDDSAEVVISSLRLGDDQGSGLFTNSNWLAFQDDRNGNAPGGTSPSDMMDEINLKGPTDGGNNSCDDEVVVGEEEKLAESRNITNDSSNLSTNFFSGLSDGKSMNGGTLNESEQAGAAHDMGFFRFEASENKDLFRDRPLPDWVGWAEPSDMQVPGSSTNPFVDHDDSDSDLSFKSQLGSPNSCSPSSAPANGMPTPRDSSEWEGDLSQKSAAVPSLFEDDVEFVGVELEGTEKAMEQALKEGIVGEAGPLKRNVVPKVPEKDNSEEGGRGMKEFNDANYWRVDQEVAVLE
ncbi:uncharacterized protein LOC129315834 isoform X2 [Prosopis cineraria]|uniref:uncharacterized protein LOC129315834 isoform X2 n=1 Tax=Prosopis cineraria TaxID=364024 RepID=UPI00240FEF00|nr:uncharacterized protein LOC129315834 isoform X2 [Prosopis cineraria]